MPTSSAKSATSWDQAKSSTRPPPKLDQQENLMPRRSNKRNAEPAATAAMLKNAADIFSEALFLIDRSRRIILANNAAQQMTTLEETSLIGQQIETILALENPQTQLKVTSIKLPPKELLVLRAKIHAVPHSATFLPLNYIPYFAAFKPRPIALAIVTPFGSNGDAASGGHC